MKYSLMCLLILVLLTVSPTGTQVIPTWAIEDDGIRSLDWSPDGSHIAIGRQDGTVQILDATTKQILFTFAPGDLGGPSAVGWNPDGSKLASGNADGVVRIWDSTTGQQILSLPAQWGLITSIAWSPDGSKLASSSIFGYPENIWIWDLTTQQVLFKISLDQAYHVDWSPAGSLLAGVGAARNVCIWNSSTGNLETVLVGHDFIPVFVDWNPIQSEMLASVGLDKTVRIWDVSLELPLLTTLRGHTDAVVVVVWSPDGSKLATASLDGTARIWDVATGQALHIIQKDNSLIYAVAWSPDGSRLAYGGESGSLEIVPVHPLLEAEAARVP